MKGYAPSSGKKVWWKCKTGNLSHRWDDTIKHRTGKDKRGCPKCSQSKMQSYGETVLTELVPEYIQRHVSEVQRYKKTRYDSVATLHNGSKLFIEYNGEQHYKFNTYYNTKNNIDHFIEKRLIVDHSKCEYAVRNGFFLSISHMCNTVETIRKIITEFIVYLNSLPTGQTHGVSRHYITGESYTQYNSEISPKIQEVGVTSEKKKSDDFLSVYQICYYNVKNLVRDKPIYPKINVCEICDEIFICGHEIEHYETDRHISVLEEMPIFIENDDGELVEVFN